MSSPQHYRCEENVVKLLEIKKLKLNALRLVHATYHYLDNHPAWEPSYMALRESQGTVRSCTVLSAHLCQTTGSPGSNDISMVHEGIRDLKNVGLFETLELDGRKLKFRYSHSMATAATKHVKAKFSMIDCGKIAQLRSPWQVYFYIRAEMAHRQNFPSFYLPRVCPEKEPWNETKRTWLAAACRVGTLLKHHYIFIPELDPLCENIVRVKVKIVHSKSQWSAGKLFPRHSPEPLSIVSNGKSQTLTRNELKKRRDWTTFGG